MIHKLEIGSPHWTISATGSAWAFSPRNGDERRE